MLHPGDTLLLLADNNFFRQWYHSADFYLISSTEPVSSKPRWQARFSLVVLIAIVALSVLNVLPLIAAAGFAAILLMMTGCISPVEVKSQIDWRVLIVIACAFGISNAVANQPLRIYFPGHSYLQLLFWHYRCSSRHLLYYQYLRHVYQPQCRSGNVVPVRGYLHIK